MSDSGHLFPAPAVLLIAVIASRVAPRPPGTSHSDGFARAEIIATVCCCLGIVVVIVIEAIGRLHQSQPVTGLA
jgi:Co/Zn/Cd efflux system component